LPLIEERVVADFETVRLSLRERRAHRRLAGLFERGVAIGGCEKIHRHITAAAERGAELLEHQKHFLIERAGIAGRLDVHRTDLSAVLAHTKIRAGEVVRVVEAHAGRSRRKRDPALAVRGNERRALFR
jgi:hypothetical protein